MTAARRFAGAIIGRAARRLGGWAIGRDFYRRRTNIVCYHGVYDRSDSGCRIFGGPSLAEFRSDLTKLAEIFDIVDLDTLLAFNRGGDAASRPLLAVTFDDGLDLERSGAIDAMAEVGIVATMFVTTGCIGNHVLLWQHKLLAMAEHRGARFLGAFNDLVDATGVGRPIDGIDRLFDVLRVWPARSRDDWTAHLWQACDMPPLHEFLAQHRPYAGWDDLARWRAAGHGIGSHSRSHPLCSSLTAAEVEDEVVAPAEALRRRFGLSSVPFAYPFGQRLPPAREALVAQRGLLSCMLGTGGLSPRGTPAHRLERADIDGDLESGIFGRPIVKALAGMA